MIFKFTLFWLVSTSLFVSDVPIIFVHGHKSEARPEGSNDDPNNKKLGGWGTWYPRKRNGERDYSISTAMTKILDSHYAGYIAGAPLLCHENTILQPMNTTKVIYNFSYYDPSGSPGVIGLSEEKVKVYIKWIYDVSGRLRPRVIAPFEPDYPPSDYDSITYYPRYVPNLIIDKAPGYGWVWFASDATLKYISSWKKGRFAKRLAEFIDKVLQATGANKVDIVAHSMGGLVARVAIKNYGCASKVRKLIMVGTPNKTFRGWWEEWYKVFSGDQPWQKNGEDLELGVGNECEFTDLNTGTTNVWHYFLGYENYIEAMSTIAGNRGRAYYGNKPNDGLVAVEQVKLNSAQFNPVIFASHGHGTLGASGELSLTECTYTTEFIKKWMIDDEDTYHGAYFIDKPTLGPFYFPPYGLRVNPKINDYKKALTIDIFLIRPDNEAVIKRRTVPIFRCHQEYLPYFIGAPIATTNWTEQGGGYSGEVIVKVVLNDMEIGKKKRKQVNG